MTAIEKRQRQRIIRFLGELGPHLLAISRTTHDHGKPSDALPHLQSVREVVERAAKALVTTPNRRRAA